MYEAEQVSLGRRVALKVLPASASHDSRQRQRFQIEAQAAALLHHDHIVPVFGIGFDQGAHYYAMQLIDGQPMTKLIQELTEQSLPGSRAGSTDRLVSTLRKQALSRRPLVDQRPAPRSIASVVAQQPGSASRPLWHSSMPTRSV